MKNIIYLLLLNFSISCSSQVTKIEFVNYLNNSTSITAKYGTKNYIKATVVSPIDINIKFKSILDAMISKDTDIKNLNFCNKYRFDYKVKTLCANFISIEKSTTSMFCQNYDDIDIEVLNLFLAKDGNVYYVNIKKNSYLTTSVSKFISTADVDCGYDVDVTNYLMIDNRKFKLFLIKDKVCNQAIDISTDSLDLVFTK